MSASYQPNIPALRNRAAYGPVRPLVVPLWLGAERRGVDKGAVELASALRDRWGRADRAALAARLLPDQVIPTPVPPDADHHVDERTLRFLPQVGETCAALADGVCRTIQEGGLALALGGDHALSAGSIAGALRAASPEGRLGVLWLDSHGDLNTPASSPSGHLHGMVLASALGLGEPRVPYMVPGHDDLQLDPNDICILGARDLDPDERALIARHGIWMLTMEEWVDAGFVAGLRAALAHLERRHVSAVLLSFDLDVMDPVDLPGTGTTVPGGLLYREASALMRVMRAWDGPLVAVDWVELNPRLDPSGGSTNSAVGLLATLLGETQR